MRGLVCEPWLERYLATGVFDPVVNLFRLPVFMVADGDDVAVFESAVDHCGDVRWRKCLSVVI